MEYIAVGYGAEGTLRPDDVEDALLALDVHGQALETVGDLAHHRPAVEAPDLLEVGELRDLHAVEPNPPAEPPRTEGGRLPVVLDEADIVRQRIEAERAKRPQIQLLKIVWRRLDRDLELIVVLQPERILAVTAIGGPARGLHIGGTPGLGPHRTQERCGMEGPRAHLHVVRLQDYATLLRPVILQRKDQTLEGAGGRHGRRPQTGF